MTLALFNPVIASENLGDQIIADAVHKHLAAMLPNEQIVQLTTQEVIGTRTAHLSTAARYRVVGGTNLLSSHMLRYRQWKINLFNAPRLGGVLLMGVGWWQYQSKPDLYTRSVLRGALARQGLHSVRDGYTRDKLASIGIINVINTCCPTLWNLTPDHCAQVPTGKADEVVLTLTDYNRAPETDAALIDLLHDRYAKVHYWPQGTGDLLYVRDELRKMDKVSLIPPSLEGYDAVVAGNNVDFVGTRLHAGVRALQHGRRTLILAVDNRSREISRDVGLPVVERDDMAVIAAAIDGQRSTEITLPVEAIAQWKAQFV